MDNIIPIIMGAIGIGLAIGLTWYRNRQEKQLRIRKRNVFCQTDKK